MRNIKKLLSNKKILFISAGAFLFLFIAGEMLFTIHELLQNEASFLLYSEAEQRLLTEQNAYYLEKMAETGRTEEELIASFSEIMPVTGNRWGFLCAGEEVLFSKDQNMTDNLNADITREVFIAAYSGKDTILTLSEFSVNEVLYTVGMVSDVDYLILSCKLNRHKMYLLIAVGIISLLFTGSFLFFVLTLNKKERKISSMSLILENQNKKLEQLAVKTELPVLIRNEELEQGVIKKYGDGQKLYDLDVILALLNKSGKQKLYPFTLCVIHFVLFDKYFTKDQMLQMIEPVKLEIKSSHVLAEAAKGTFALLLYQTEESEAELLLKNVQKRWEEFLPKLGVSVKLERKTLVHGDSDPVLEFQDMYERVRKEAYEIPTV